MTSRLCVHCNIEPSRGANDLLCKNCRAEKILMGEDVSVKALDTLSGRSQNVSVTVEDKATGFVAKAIRCDGCGEPQLYDPSVRKKSYFCDVCHAALCPRCAAYCIHKDWGMAQKVLCKNCRAEKSLTGLPVEEVEGSLPGQETEAPKREPKPHCGRATCVADPKLVEYDRTHQCPTPGCTDHPSFCECKCPKCFEAVASGFVEPMFGKMTPDPDPEPEPAQDESDEEEEIARAEGSQP